MRKTTRLLLAGALFLTMTAPAAAQKISEEARRYMLHGEAAMEMAESKTDYQDAVVEFRKATRLAPDWAAAWYNLGFTQDKAGDFAGAIDSLKKYIALNPGTSDRAEVEDWSVKLEYKRDKTQKAKKKARADKWGHLSGQWCPVEGRCEGRFTSQQFISTYRPFSVKVSGNKIIIRHVEEIYNTGFKCSFTDVNIYTGTVDTGGFIKGTWVWTTTWQKSCAPYGTPPSSVRGTFSGDISGRGEIISLKSQGTAIEQGVRVSRSRVLKRKD